LHQQQLATTTSNILFLKNVFSSMYVQKTPILGGFVSFVSVSYGRKYQHHCERPPILIILHLDE
jgi:hypothetical protein